MTLRIQAVVLVSCPRNKHIFRYDGRRTVSGCVALKRAKCDASPTLCFVRVITRGQSFFKFASIVYLNY